MKKIYNAPEVGVCCFRPLEGLASELDFNKLISIRDNDVPGGSGDAAETSASDIKIKI